MMRFKMTSNGIDSYTSALEKRLKYVKEKLADEIKTNLEIFSPKRTGKLASSYDLKTTDTEVQISNDCGYCKFVNDGTRFQAGQHFIELSVAQAKEKINSIVEDSQKISK